MDDPLPTGLTLNSTTGFCVKHVNLILPNQINFTMIKVLKNLVC